MAQEPNGPDEQPPRTKRLRKSADEKVLFGVAGGIAEYLDIDPILVRVVFVALAFAGGMAVLIYVILAILMPGPDDEGADFGANLRGSPSQAIGIVLVGVGVLLLLVNLGVLDAFPWHITWPVAIIAAGLLILLARARS